MKIKQRIPATYFRGASYEKLFTQHPSGNRGGMGKMPTSDAEALAMINASLPDREEPLTSEHVYLHYMEAASDTFIADRFAFLDESTLKNIATGAQSGFAFMNSHRTGYRAELPHGRTFCGRYEKIRKQENDDDSDESLSRRALVGVYMLQGVWPNPGTGPTNDDLHKMIDGGTVFDCSVGLGGGTYMCDVCNKTLYGRWEDGSYCPHYPGSTYEMTDEQKATQEARGIPGGAATVTIVGAYCNEVSAVYDGAIPGAGFGSGFMSFLKVGEQIDRGLNIPQDIVQDLSKTYALNLSPQEAVKGAKEMFATFSKHSPIEDKYIDDDPENPEETLDKKSKKPSLSATKENSMNLKLKMMLVALGLSKPELKAKLSADEPTGTLKATLGILGLNKQEALALIDADETETDDKELLAKNVQLQKEKDDLKKQLDDQGSVNTALVATLTTLTTSVEAINKQLQEKEAGAALASAKTQIDVLKRQFKITPAQAKDLEKLAEENPTSFTASISIFANAAPIRDIVGGAAPTSLVATNAKDISDTVDKKAKEFMDKNNVTDYRMAVTKVLEENPELTEQYMQEMAA
jgi:hypothetical protein